MLMHQGIGLEAFNALPLQKAVHALYECCYCVALAADLARGRPYASHDQLFRRADALLFATPECSVAAMLQAYPHIGRRPGSLRSAAEQSAISHDRAEVMAELKSAARRYNDQFGFDFVMFVGGADAETVLGTIVDRMHNDHETERKVVRNELARINRSRLERMLGPEGGYDNW
jgi:OHCU decarboxylase